ncbi:MAG: hypothetical protein AB7S48_16345 [Bacteroidales bacterium]
MNYYMRSVTLALLAVILLHTFNLFCAERSTTGCCPIYELQMGEELVYGKVGLNSDCDIKYTFAIVRKPNLDKPVFRQKSTLHGSTDNQNTITMELDPNPMDYDRFDYWVVFNKQKFGPYDRVEGIDPNEPDVDEWVSRDGKSISFIGVKGKQHYAIVGSKVSHGFLGANPELTCDVKSGKNTFAVKWADRDFRLMEDGATKLSGWQALENIVYSEDGTNLLYVGARDNLHEKYIYLNNDVIAGPYYCVTQLGFIPGTNRVYFAGFNQRIEDGVAMNNYEYIAIANKRIIIPDGSCVGDFKFCNGRVSLNVNADCDGFGIKDKASDGVKDFTIYEYDVKSGETNQLEGYSLSLQTAIVGNSFYYMTYDKLGNYLLVKEGGTILDKVTKAERGDNTVYFKVSPNGDFYTYFSNSADKSFALKKNGKPFAVSNTPIMGIDKLSFSAATDNLQMVITTNKTEELEARTIINGDSLFCLNGKMDVAKTYFASEGNPVYSFIQSNSGANAQYRLYRNGNLLNNTYWGDVPAFSLSCNGERYAMLTINDGVGGVYYPKNSIMNLHPRLIVDGKIMEGVFGAPIWSPKESKFMVIRQNNAIIEIVEV